MAERTSLQFLEEQRRIAQQNLDRWDHKIQLHCEKEGIPHVSAHKREYLFACLAEESGEVAQAVGKILRFGELDFHPKTGNVPNIELLRREVNELISVAEMLGITADPELIAAKRDRVERYYNYALNALFTQRTKS